MKDRKRTAGDTSHTTAAKLPGVEFARHQLRRALRKLRGVDKATPEIVEYIRTHIHNALEALDE